MAAQASSFFFLVFHLWSTNKSLCPDHNGSFPSTSTGTIKGNLQLMQPAEYLPVMVPHLEYFTRYVGRQRKETFVCSVLQFWITAFIFPFFFFRLVDVNQTSNLKLYLILVPALEWQSGNRTMFFYNSNYCSYFL